MDLQQTIERMLAEHFGQQARVAHIEQRPFVHQTSHAMDAVDVELDDGVRLELLLKDLNRDRRLDAARRTKPEFLYNPLREIAIYRHVLPNGPPGTAACYGAQADIERDCYWLLLERVSGRELYQVGERPLWQAAAQWLSRMHCHWSEHLDALPKTVPLLVHDGDYYRRWLERAAEFQAKKATPLPGNWARLIERYEQVIDRLTSLPKTFIHGEAYASNVLVTEPEKSDGKASSRVDRPHPGPLPDGEGTGIRVCPIDWEMAAIGPGLIDLAALTAGKWSEPERVAMVEAYRVGMAAAGGRTTTLDEIQQDLDFCRLHMAVQWLGWSADWKPSSRRAHDWLAEASELAEKIGI